MTFEGPGQTRFHWVQWLPLGLLIAWVASVSPTPGSWSDSQATVKMAVNTASAAMDFLNLISDPPSDR